MSKAEQVTATKATTPRGKRKPPPLDLLYAAALAKRPPGYQPPTIESARAKLREMRDAKKGPKPLHKEQA